MNDMILKYKLKTTKSLKSLRIAALILLFISLWACVPKAPVQKKPESSSSDKTASLSLNKKASPEKSVSEEEKKGDEWSDFTGPLELQRENPRSRILPESFLVGPFSDPLSLRPEERDIVYLIDEFWKSFKKGKTESSLLASYPHPLFLEELENYSEIGKEIRAVETGRPEITGNSGRMLCLVCSETGCLEGSLYLIREEGNWFIEDWEIPFRDWPGKAPGREEDRISSPANW